MTYVVDESSLSYKMSAERRTRQVYRSRGGEGREITKQNQKQKRKDRFRQVVSRGQVNGHKTTPAQMDVWLVTGTKQKRK